MAAAACRRAAPPGGVRWRIAVRSAQMLRAGCARRARLRARERPRCAGSAPGDAVAARALGRALVRLCTTLGATFIKVGPDRVDARAICCRARWWTSCRCCAIACRPSPSPPCARPSRTSSAGRSRRVYADVRSRARRRRVGGAGAPRRAARRRARSSRSRCGGPDILEKVRARPLDPALRRPRASSAACPRSA